MLKKRVNLFNFNLAILQIILLVSLSFAFSFILNSGMVGAAEEITIDLISGSGKSVTSGAAAKTTNLRLTGEGLNTAKITIPKKFIEGGTADVSGTFGGAVRNGEGVIDSAIVNGKSFPLNPEGAAALPNVVAAKGLALEGPYPYKLPFLGTELTGAVAHLAQGLVWSLVVAGAIQLIGTLAGVDKEGVNAATFAAIGGIMTFKGILALGSDGAGLLGAKVLGLPTKIFAGIAGIAVGVVIFIALYKKEKKKIVSLQCLPWEPPLGGLKCEQCNNDPFRPCSEYRCKSLGQACELINAGTTEETCVWKSRGDVIAPIIQPWDSALKPQGLAYVPDDAIRPPNRGVKIARSGARRGCLEAFTPLEFGLIANEPAQCKLDWSRDASFSEMQFFFGETNFFLQNHTQRLRLPGPDSTESDVIPELENNGEFGLFVRCMDANGNVNEDAFVFNFCVDPGPDTTPPIIEGTSINSGSPVQFNADAVPIELYVNEPAECKWSRQDKDYDSMENEMSCAKETFQINSALTYTCSADLTGIENRNDNKFYFRCKDLPGKPENERNVNSQSTELVLRGTEPLSILQTAPNATIFGTTGVIPVTLTAITDDGADEGKSICYFSPSGELDSFIAMFETNSYKHSQKLDLTPGSYTYYFRCIDAGGNAAESVTGFTIFVDRTAPKITRVYKDDVQNSLKVVTDEESECAYSLNSCNFVFDEGLSLIYENPAVKRVHLAEWKPRATYYVKCRDEFGNEPSPNACSVVASAIELSPEGV